MQQKWAGNARKWLNTIFHHEIKKEKLVANKWKKLSVARETSAEHPFPKISEN